MSTSATSIAIYGVGGFGREVAWLAEACSCAERPVQVACFVDDNEQLHGQFVNDIPVMGLAQSRKAFPEARVIGAIGAPRARQAVMEKVALAGSRTTTLIHPRVERSRRVDIGEGTVICAGNILTTNISIGRHVQLNLDCTVGHDVIMADYVTLAPGVHVSGYVHFGQRVYVGTGAVIINGNAHEPLIIGDDAVIGAAACVTKSVAAGLTVVGVPARPIHR
jgi:sugar O-acyltransferase (sialic acid O-acetyltransferase NeuD family)